jgi:hypothetical protein
MFTSFIPALADALAARRDAASAVQCGGAHFRTSWATLRSQARCRQIAGRSCAEIRRCDGGAGEFRLTSPWQARCSRQLDGRHWAAGARWRATSDVPQPPQSAHMLYPAALLVGEFLKVKGSH